MNNWPKIKEKIKKAPKTPGVYIFYEKRDILYIGKASNLKNRLQSYLKSGDFKNDRLQENATNLKLIPLRSEIEALIEEAKLIKKFNPPYNVLWRDDKTYFYAAITKDKFPKIFVAHKSKTLNPKPYTLNPDFVGPFTEGRALRLVLRMLRRSFPYCTCPKSHLRLCLNSQIGNCFGFCCAKNSEASAEQIKKYKKNIDVIKNFLLGKPLKGFSKNIKPEEKSALEKILAHREFLENFDSSKVISQKSSVKSYLVECYDISHLSGKETVAGMTAWSFKNGKLLPRKDFWRKFIIRTAKPSDDPAAIYETISRRLNHPEWPYPNLIVIDGGAGQFAAAKKAAAKFGLAPKTKIISFAKPESMVYGLKETPVHPHTITTNGKNSGAKRNSSFGVGVKINDAPPDIQKIIPPAISGTHDFAIRFHRQRRKKNFLNSAEL